MKTSMIHSHLTNKSVSRRAAISGILATGLIGGAFRANALTAPEAERLITTVVNEVLGIVNASSSDATKIRQFEQIFAKYADVTLIGRSLLGPPWRNTSAGDRRAYIDALSGYLARKYGKRFREFEGGKVEIVKSTNLGGRKGVLVETRVSTAASRPFPVEWQVIESGGKTTFFDIVIEGIRLLSMEKTEIRALLAKNQGSVTRLAAVLKGLG